MGEKITRITLESFYHCGDDDPSTRFLTPFEREVTACDYPIEHVEKAVVWRLQQPSSTKAALFVNKFKLSALQLVDLLKLINTSRSSTTTSEVDQAACRWLNENRDAWEDWLPDNELYDHPLYQWDKWLIACGLVSLVGGVIVYLYLEYSTAKGEEAEAQAENISYSTVIGKEANDDADKKEICINTHSSWPADKDPAESCVLSFLSCMWVAAFSRFLDKDKWDPVFEYLYNSFRCMVNAKKCKYRGCFPCQREKKDNWSFSPRLVIFALGQLFVGASTGFFEGLIYSSWLTYGLNQLSLEVTISCALIMITLKLVKWVLNSLPSGKQIVRRQLQIRLRIKFIELYSNKWDSDVQNETKLYCVQRFENAIDKTANELASDCYFAAWSVFSDLLGFLSAIAFLFYYTFNEGTTQYVSSLLIVAFVCAPVWLCIVLLVGPVLRKGFAEAKAKAKDSGWTAGLIMWTLTYKTAYGGILWTVVYFLWAFGPILINPLKNNLGPGTNIVLPDLLAVSKRHTQHVCASLPSRSTTLAQHIACCSPHIAALMLCTPSAKRLSAQVLKVLGTMGTSLIDLEGALSTMAKTSSKAAEVAILLSLKDVNGVSEIMKAEAKKKAEEDKKEEARKNKRVRIESMKKWCCNKKKNVATAMKKWCCNKKKNVATASLAVLPTPSNADNDPPVITFAEAKAQAIKAEPVEVKVYAVNLEQAAEEAHAAFKDLAYTATAATQQAKKALHEAQQAKNLPVPPPPLAPESGTRTGTQALSDNANTQARPVISTDDTAPPPRPPPPASRWTQFYNWFGRIHELHGFGGSK